MHSPKQIKLSVSVVKQSILNVKFVFYFQITSVQLANTVTRDLVAVVT